MLNGSGNSASRTVRQARRRPTSKLTIEQRAVIAAILSESSTSQRRACDLICVNANYVSKVRAMSQADRRRVARGEIKLSPLVNGHRKRRQVDAKLDRLVAHYGAELVMATLDRATRPTVPSASATKNDDGPAEWWTEMMTAPQRVAAE